MRKELLGRSDWLRLSICRPPDIRFSSATDMAKIGRPRKQTKGHDRTAANTQSNNSNHFTPKVLGKRKRSVEQCDPSEAPPQHHEPIPSREPSSFLSSRIPASSPPKQIELSGSIKSSDANTSLSLPPIPLSDPNRSTYMLVNDQADPVEFDEELIPLEMARRMESFDDVQERYLSSRSGPRCGVGHGTSRLTMDVDSLISPSRLNSKLVSRLFESKTVQQELVLSNQQSGRNGRPLESADQGTTVPAQTGRHRGGYQLSSEFADTAYSDGKLPTNEVWKEVEGAVASSSELSPFFPQSAANEVDVTEFTRAVAEGPPSNRMPTCMSTIETDRSRVFSLERQYPAVPSRCIILDNNQVHSSGIESLYQHSAAKSARRFKLDKRFDPPTEPRAVRTQMIEPTLASQRSPSILNPYSPNFTPEGSTFSVSERPISGANDEIDLHGTRSRLLPAHKCTTMPGGGLGDYDNTSVTHARDERPTQSSFGIDYVGSGSSAVFNSPRRGRRSFVAGLSSSAAQSNKYVLTDQSRDRVPLRSVKHNRGAAGQVYGKNDGAPPYERTPRRAAHRGDPQSHTFTTPQSTVGVFDLHSTENCFPLLYSGRSR